jgi:transposase InsO family protein
MDVMHDTLADQNAPSVLTVVDTFTRECMALELARSFSGSDVGRVLRTG